MELGLRDRTFVVTGGSRGLGFATAQALAAEGARVAMVARDPDRLAEAITALPGSGHLAIATDLAQPGAGARIMSAVQSISPTLDGVLVNVGGPVPGSVLELDDTQWREAIDGVLLASVRLLRALVPSLGEGASVAMVLSSTAKEPIHALGASNALRPGLAMIVKDLADALAPKVRVNGLLPGRIATDRLRSLAMDDAELASGIPLGRAGDPEEFGRVAAFLLSPAASYVTGTLVAVDGGLLRSPW